MFAILKVLASQDIEIIGEGVVEVLQDGFGFLRSANANYLPSGRYLYFASQIRRFSLKTRDTSKGRSVAHGRRALFRAFEGQHINFDDPKRFATRFTSTIDAALP